MELFDPNNVERKEGLTWNLAEFGGRECVLAEDYDRLLEIVRSMEESYVMLKDCIAPLNDVMLGVIKGFFLPTEMRMAKHPVYREDESEETE